MSGKTIRIKLLVAVIVEGRHRTADEELEAPIDEAGLLVLFNQAVALEPMPLAIESRDPRPRGNARPT